MSTIRISIPAVVNRAGIVEGWIIQDEAGEHHEDVGLMYDNFEEGDEIREIRIEAEIDLDAVFSDVTIQGAVSTTSAPHDGAET